MVNALRQNFNSHILVSDGDKGSNAPDLIIVSGDICVKRNDMKKTKKRIAEEKVDAAFYARELMPENRVGYSYYDKLPF